MKKRLYIITLLFTLLFFVTNRVKAKDNNIPEIQLNGSEFIYLEKGTEYHEYGAIAIDVEDGNLSENIEIDSSSLNIHQTGIYSIKYTVKDSDMNVVLKERFVQVFDQIYEEKNISIDDTNIVGIFPIDDENYIVFSHAYNLGIVTFIDKLGNIDETKNFLLSDNEGDLIQIIKIIETKDNNYFILGRNEAENSSLLIIIDKNGEVLSQASFENLDVVFDVTEYQVNNFILTDGTKLFYFEGTNYQDAINIETTIDNLDSLSNGSIVTYSNDTDKAYINITDFEEKILAEVNLIDMFIQDNKIILVGNITNSNLGCIYIMNQEGIIITSKTYDDSFKDVNLVSNYLMVVFENNGISTIEISSLNIFSSYHLSDYQMYKTLSISNKGQIVLGGLNNITLLTPNIIFHEFDNLVVSFNESFDIDTDYNITDFEGELLEYHINSVEEVLDTSIVGTHELIYNITVVSHDGPRDLRLTRTVIVLPNIIEGQIYNEPKIIDIGNLNAKLNNNEYHNEEITEAGNYELIINEVATINFRIEPDYNIEHGGIYKQGKVLVKSGVTAKYLVDGENYTPGNPYMNIGNHTLTVMSDNGYYMEIDFTITENIDLVNNQEFDYKAVIEIIGAELEIDGSVYVSGTEIYEVGNHELKIIGSNGYESTYIFTINERVSHLENNGIYTGSVTPLIPNTTLELDGNPYISGTKITEIGNHILTVKGSNGYIKEYHFTIDFETPGLEDGGIYDNFIEPIIIGGTATLNGEEYISGTKITEIGNHSLVIIGENNYQKEIRFTIRSNFPEKTYTTSVSPNINAELMILNGSVYNNEVIDSVGKYELSIMGRGGFKQTITFEIVPNYGVKNEGSYEEEVIPIISGVNAIYEIDGKPYIPGEKITSVGHHTLTVIGNNGYEVCISFTVIEKANILNNSPHFKSVTIDIPNAELFLNGESYTNKTEIKIVGNHILEIIGTNGYKKTINFVITPEVNIKQNGEYDSGLVISASNVEGIYLNNEIYLDEEITLAGNYELTIYGINDYSVSYNFIIKEKLIDIKPNGVYLGSVKPSIENGEILINGKIHQSGEIFTEIGIHELTIIGINDYQKTYTFTIEPIIEGVEDGKIYEGSVSINIENAQIKLNGEVIPNNTIISEVGNNTITIYGHGGFEKTITFIITPIIEGVKDGKTYYNSIKINIPNVKLLIDGKEYKNGTEYNKIGKHTLTIVGANDYYQEIHFTLKYSTDVLIQQIIIITVPITIIAGIIIVLIRLRKKVM